MKFYGGLFHLPAIFTDCKLYIIGSYLLSTEKERFTIFTGLVAKFFNKVANFTDTVANFAT